MLGHGQTSEPNLSKYIIDAPMLNYIIIKHTQLTLGTKYRYYTQSTGKVPNIYTEPGPWRLLDGSVVCVYVSVCVWVRALGAHRRLAGRHVRCHPTS